MINAKYSPWKRFVYGALNVCIYIGGVIVAVLAYLQKDSTEDDAGMPEWVQWIFSWGKKEGWWVILVITVFAAGAKLWRDKLQHDWTWSLIQELVDRIALEAFKGIGGDAHHHRATLFRHQWYWWPIPWRSRFWPWGCGRWPGSGWLVPIVRSGHTTQRSRTVFLAPDDADNVEGVAGAVWASDKEVTVECGKIIDQSATDVEIDSYANKTKVTSAWIRQQINSKKVLYASFRGIPVEVNGRMWGALLLDSRVPQAAANAQLNMSNHAYVLGKLLEKT